jgi:hypothetical protein
MVKKTMTRKPLDRVGKRALVRQFTRLVIVARVFFVFCSPRPGAHCSQSERLQKIWKTRSTLREGSCAAKERASKEPRSGEEPRLPSKTQKESVPGAGQVRIK